MLKLHRLGSLVAAMCLAMPVVPGGVRATVSVDNDADMTSDDLATVDKAAEKRTRRRERNLRIAAAGGINRQSVP